MRFEPGSLCLTKEWERATPPTKSSIPSDYQFHTGITQGHLLVAEGHSPFFAGPWGRLTTTQATADLEIELTCVSIKPLSKTFQTMAPRVPAG